MMMSMVSGYANPSKDLRIAFANKDKNAVIATGTTTDNIITIQVILAETDQQTIEWFEREFPEIGLDYDKLLSRAIQSSRSIPFLEWLAQERNAHVEVARFDQDRLWSDLVQQARLANIQWALQKGYYVVSPRMASEYYSRAVMYTKEGESILDILEWLFSLELQPTPEVVRSAIKYTLDVKPVIVWLALHGVSPSETSLTDAVDRLYIEKTSADEVIEVIQWLKSAYSLTFTTEHCKRAFHWAYLEGCVPLLRWGITECKPDEATLDSWITKIEEKLKASYLYRPELYAQVLGVLSAAKASP